MQFSIVRLSRCSVEERTAIGNSSKELLIGASTACDLQLHVSFGLPDQSLRVHVEDELCIAENLTGDPGLIFVNGQQVFKIMQLNDGDALQVGSDQFAVVFLPEIPAEETPESTSADDTPDEPGGSEPTPADNLSDRRNRPSLKSRILNSSVTLHHPSDEAKFESDVLPYLCEQQGAFLLVNGMAPQQVSDMSGPDLLEHWSEKLGYRESLHAVVHTDAQPKIQLGRQLSEVNACIWCVPQSDVEACLLDVQLRAAWLVRPEILRSALHGESSPFCERLMEPFRMLMIECRDAEDSWHLYTKPNSDSALTEQNATWADGL